MTDIELVIKIPEDVFKRTIFYREFRDLNDCVTTIKALEKAVFLPKGHGRLIDAEYLKQDMIRYGWHHVDCTVSEYVEDMLPTIIEADEG